MDYFPFIYQISYLLQIIRKCDKYFKNLSYFQNSATGLKKRAFFASCFLLFLYRQMMFYYIPFKC